MKKLFVNLARRLRRQPFSVAEVLADFEHKAEQLLHVQRQRAAAAHANTEAIARLGEENLAHRVEIRKAADVEGKLRALVG